MKFQNRFAKSWTAIFLTLAISGSTLRAGDEFEREPINYSKAVPVNAVSQLQEKIESGKVKLKFEKEFGYLRSVLNELNIPVSSQVLVFSKTSLQRHKIAPRTPRALYFNDDNYIGFCQNGPVLEVTAIDPKLGAVFYSMDQDETAKPKFIRHLDNCLLCHGSSQTRGVPGQIIRSVFTDRQGYPILSSGTFRIDQTSPIARRWGGWYVTGTHGKQLHLGNLLVEGKKEPEEIQNLGGLNVTQLKDRFDTAHYLTGHSDIVALMVMEHQGEMHNFITKANFQTLLALADEASLNKELGRPADFRSETTDRRIKSVGDPLVKYLLYSQEAKITEKIQGTSGFAEEFAKKAIRDSKGRSFRDFDMEKRMFKYPCSYLIYSESFQTLPEDVKSYVFQRIYDVLKEKDYTRDFDHLTPRDRQAIYEIIRDTVPNLSGYWLAKK